MKNNNFISATLLASALALSPVITPNLNAASPSKINTISSSIANILHRRGLDEDAAINISNNFIDEHDEMLFSMIDNLQSACSILSKDEIMQYLASLALRNQSVDLDSYSFLVGMTYEIIKRPLDAKTLGELENIALKNSFRMTDVIL